MDDLTFVQPVYLGQLCILTSRVTRSWNTSMEVQVSEYIA